MVRKTRRRRSARLNPGSFEVAEICDKLHEDATVPSAPSSNVPKLQEPNAGKDMVGFYYFFLFFCFKKKNHNVVMILC